MQQKEQQTFNDGLVLIFKTDSDGIPAEKLFQLRFEERVVGMNRYFTALSVSKKISRVIRIPQRRSVTTEEIARIGEEYYEIIQIQFINDTSIPVMDLTLKRVGIKGNVS